MLLFIFVDQRSCLRVFKAMSLTSLSLSYDRVLNAFLTCYFSLGLCSKSVFKTLHTEILTFSTSSLENVEMISGMICFDR